MMMISQLLSVNLRLLSRDMTKELVGAEILLELECPICTDYMHPPIRQCTIGHSFCDKCHEKVSKCPTCRNPKGMARNYTLERLHQKLMFPCKNKIVGCAAIVSGMSIKDHEETCPFVPLDCPLKAINNCIWRGYMTDVVKHCKDNHPRNIYLTSRQTLTCTNFLLKEHPMCFYCILFKAHGEIFKATLQINYETGIMRWCVFHLGSYTSEAATQYSYEIEIENRKLVEQKITLRSTCQPVKPNDKTFSDEHCLITHFEMIKHFCMDDDLLYTVQIFNHIR